MEGIACSSEPGLHEQRFVVANTEVGNGLAAGYDLPEGRRLYPAGKHWYLDDDPDRRGVETKPRHGSNHTRTTNRGGLHGGAVAHHDNYRDHPRKREIDLIDFATCLEENVALSTLHRREVRQKKLKIPAGQCGQQLVAERPRIDAVQHGALMPVGLIPREIPPFVRYRALNFGAAAKMAARRAHPRFGSLSAKKPSDLATIPDQPSFAKNDGRSGDMSEGERRKLEHRLAQARRLAAEPVDELTKERIAGLIRDLEQKLGDKQEQRS